MENQAGKRYEKLEDSYQTPSPLTSHLTKRNGRVEIQKWTVVCLIFNYIILKLEIHTSEKTYCIAVDQYSSSRPTVLDSFLFRLNKIRITQNKCLP